MEAIKIGLTNDKPVVCDCYLYPAQLYDIEGLEQYDDIETIYQYTYENLKKYRGLEVNLYINGGLSLEVLSAILIASKLEIILHVFHWNRENGHYLEQKIRKQTECRKKSGNEIIKRSLCAGRHSEVTAIPIFEEIPKERVLDFEWMQKKADDELKNFAGMKLQVYVTGLKQAMISVWNAARKYSIELEALHYDKDTEDYFAQTLE